MVWSPEDLDRVLSRAERQESGTSPSRPRRRPRRQESPQQLELGFDLFSALDRAEARQQRQSIEAMPGGIGLTGRQYGAVTGALYWMWPPHRLEELRDKIAYLQRHPRDYSNDFFFRSAEHELGHHFGHGAWVLHPDLSDEEIRVALSKSFGLGSGGLSRGIDNFWGVGGTNPRLEIGFRGPGQLVFKGKKLIELVRAWLDEQIRRNGPIDDDLLAIREIVQRPILGDPDFPKSNPWWPGNA